MFASRWHSPPKAGSVLIWVTGTWRWESRSASRLPRTSPSSTPTRTSPVPPSSARSSSVVLPAPGALIRLMTVTPAASKSARLASAIVWLASSAPSATRTVVWCISGGSHGLLAHVNRLDHQLVPADHAVISGATGGAAEADDQLVLLAGRGRRGVPLLAAIRAGEPRVDPLPLERGALAESLLGGDLEVEAQVLGDDLAQASDPDADDRDRLPLGVALGRGDDRLGDGELVHLSSPR